MRCLTEDPQSGGMVFSRRVVPNLFIHLANHSPHETVDLRDVSAAVSAVQLLAKGWPNADFSVKN